MSTLAILSLLAVAGLCGLVIFEIVQVRCPVCRSTELSPSKQPQGWAKRWRCHNCGCDFGEDCR